MFLQQGGRHWNSFAIIATDGANPLDVYLHVVCIWSNGYMLLQFEPWWVYSHSGT